MNNTITWVMSGLLAGVFVLKEKEYTSAISQPAIGLYTLQSFEKNLGKVIIREKRRTGGTEKRI